MTILNGTRGIATWGEDQSGEAALNNIDGAMLMAVRCGVCPLVGEMVSLNMQRWIIVKEKPASVAGMRLFVVEQMSNAG